MKRLREYCTEHTYKYIYRKYVLRLNSTTTADGTHTWDDMICRCIIPILWQVVTTTPPYPVISAPQSALQIPQLCGSLSSCHQRAGQARTMARIGFSIALPVDFSVEAVTNLLYSVIKGLVDSRPQAGCHLPNSHWPEMIYPVTVPGRFGQNKSRNLVKNVYSVLDV